MQEVRDKANANLSTCRHGHKASILMMPRTHPWNQSFTKWVTMTRTIIPEETTGQKLLFAFGIHFKDHAYPAHWQHKMLVRAQSKNNLSHLCWWGCKIVWALWNTGEQFPIKPWWPISAIMLLCMYLNESKSSVLTKTRMWMFTAALIIMPKLGSNPPIGECRYCATSKQWDDIEH